MSINTEQFSIKMRGKAIDVPNQRLLVTNFHASEQEPDLSEPANCAGFGRIRHFRRIGAFGWSENPLPIDPAAQKIGLPKNDVLKAQVFQNAACNWRCWYCFVPFNLLSANPQHSGWLSAADLLNLYDNELDAPVVIDLSGGQPDLTPEWVPWMMRELGLRGMSERVYLWSDDNLSNDYFWQFLSKADIDLICAYRNYGKVCCFKGFDSESFAFNTNASPELFERQFILFQHYLELGIDLYAYVTFTTPSVIKIADKVQTFVDRLQSVSPNLPLRVVPLEVRAFAPVQSRMNNDHHTALKLQWDVLHCWKTELEKRFTSELRRTPIYEIPI